MCDPLCTSGCWSSLTPYQQSHPSLPPPSPMSPSSWPHLLTITNDVLCALLQSSVQCSSVIRVYCQQPRETAACGFYSSVDLLSPNTRTRDDPPLSAAEILTGCLCFAKRRSLYLRKTCLAPCSSPVVFLLLLCCLWSPANCFTYSAPPAVWPIYVICFWLCHADDFADEEEVQSFGYKRFGEWEVTFSYFFYKQTFFFFCLLCE